MAVPPPPRALPPPLPERRVRYVAGHLPVPAGSASACPGTRSVVRVDDAGHLDAGLNRQLPIDLSQVVVHGVRREEKKRSGLSVGEPPGRLLRDVALGFGQ